MIGLRPDGESRTHLPALSLAALASLNLLNYLDRYVLPAVVGPLERDLGLNDSQFGTVATAFMLGYFITSPFFGYLGDRFPRKVLIIAGVVIWSLATIASGFSHGFLSLALFRVIVGLGEASYGTISPGWIADLFPPARRSQAISLFYVAIPVGSAVGFILGGAIAAHWGWRAAFFVAGAPGLLLALALPALSEPKRGASEPHASQGTIASQKTSFRDLWHLPAYRLVVAGYVAQTFALGGFGTWAAAFLERVHHMNFAAADRFFGVALATTGLVATLAGGWLGAAWQRGGQSGYAWLLALSALAAVPAAYAALVVRDLAWCKAAMAAAMFLLFIPTGPVNTLILEAVPVVMRARAMAVSIFAIHLLGDLWSPQIIGILSFHFGGIQRATLATLPPAIAICALFWFLLAVRFTLPGRPEPLPGCAADPGERTSSAG